MLAEPTPSRCTWHHCVPFSPEPKWSVNPPNVSVNLNWLLILISYLVIQMRDDNPLVKIKYCLRLAMLTGWAMGEQ
jgi:hypothetical protein